jgi:transglutaminase/protease-like cytokinesis protein 3
VLPIPTTDNINWITAANNKSTQDQHSEVVTNPKRRNGLLAKIKQRLYNNIIPSGYHNPIGRTWNAIIHN